MMQNALAHATDRALRCLVCTSVDHRRVFVEGGIEILRCRRCGHVFSSFPSNPHYDGFWGEEVVDDDQFYWRSARRRMFEDFIHQFVDGRSGRLLDVGCGLGFFLKAVASQPGWEVHGCEISPAAARYAREKLGLSSVTTGRLDEAGFSPGSFDVITMWDVLDHLREPDPLLSQCQRLLKDNGFCFIRVPNVVVQLARARVRQRLGRMRPDVACLQPRDHAHHYSATSISRILHRNGFAAVQFVHLHPVEDTSGPQAWAKRLVFAVVCAVDRLSRGRLNFDNLFVVAQKLP